MRLDRIGWVLCGAWLVAALAMALFTHSPTLATMGDDSASYLMLAQYLSPFQPHLPRVADWVGYDSHYQPLFPLLLAVFGGDHDLPRGHAVVAGCFALALWVCYHFCREQAGRRVAVLVCGVFLLLPGTWLSSVGILSENLYLATSMAALWAYQRAKDTRGYLLTGLLMAAACATRLIGIALLFAMLLPLLVSHRQQPRRAIRPALLMLLPAVALQLPWLLLRPRPNLDWSGYGYVAAAESAISWFSFQPIHRLLDSANSLAEGWMRMLALAPERTEISVSLAGLIFVLAVCGWWQRFRQNHADAWYVLGYVGILFLWPYMAEARRLIYVIAPLLLLYIYVAMAAVHRRWPNMSLPTLQTIATALCVPLALIAQLQLQSKALNRQAVVDQIGYAHILNYLHDPREQRAQLVASNQIGTLAGFMALSRITEPTARIMWLRPNYIAILGQRYGVPLSHRWSRRELWQAMLTHQVDYVVLARISKTDLNAQSSDQVTQMADVASIGNAVFMIKNPQDGGIDFVLVKIDHARLKSALAIRD